MLRARLDALNDTDGLDSSLRRLVDEAVARGARQQQSALTSVVERLEGGLAQLEQRVGAMEAMQRAAVDAASAPCAPAPGKLFNAEPLPAEWTEHSTANGLCYYFNKRDGSSTWVRPGTPSDGVRTHAIVQEAVAKEAQARSEALGDAMTQLKSSALSHCEQLVRDSQDKQAEHHEASARRHGDLADKLSQHTASSAEAKALKAALIKELEQQRRDKAEFDMRFGWMKQHCVSLEQQLNQQLALDRDAKRNYVRHDEMHTLHAHSATALRAVRDQVCLQPRAPSTPLLCGWLFGRPSPPFARKWARMA